MWSATCTPGPRGSLRRVAAHIERTRPYGRSVLIQVRCWRDEGGADDQHHRVRRRRAGRGWRRGRLCPCSGGPSGRLRRGDYCLAGDGDSDHPTVWHGDPRALVQLGLTPGARTVAAWWNAVASEHRFGARPDAGERPDRLVGRSPTARAGRTCTKVRALPESQAERLDRRCSQSASSRPARLITTLRPVLEGPARRAAAAREIRPGLAAGHGFTCGRPCDRRVDELSLSASWVSRDAALDGSPQGIWRNGPGRLAGGPGADAQASQSG